MAEVGYNDTAVDQWLTLLAGPNSYFRQARERVSFKFKVMLLDTLTNVHNVFQK